VVLAVVATTNWPDVALALIAALPGILTLVFQIILRSNLKTPSGEPLGKVVEFAHDTAIANNMRLTAITDKVGATVSPSNVALEDHLQNGVSEPAPPQS
jgi:hypothetical protein